MNKKFDCVEMKHQGAEKIKKKTSQLSAEKELEFWQKQTQSLRKYKEFIVKKQRVTA